MNSQNEKTAHKSDHSTSNSHDKNSKMKTPDYKPVFDQKNSDQGEEKTHQAASTMDGRKNESADKKTDEQRTNPKEFSKNEHKNYDGKSDRV